MNLKFLRALSYDASVTDVELMRLCEYNDGLLARAVTEICTCAGGSLTSPTFRIGAVDMYDGNNANAVILCDNNAHPRLSIRQVMEDGKAVIHAFTIVDVRVKDSGKDYRVFKSTRPAYIAKCVAETHNKILGFDNDMYAKSMLCSLSNQIISSINTEKTYANIEVDANTLLAMLNAINGVGQVDSLTFDNLRSTAEKRVAALTLKSDRVKDEIMSKKYWFVQNYGEYGFRVATVVPDPVMTEHQVLTNQASPFVLANTPVFYRSLADMQARNPNEYQQFYVQMVMSKNVVGSLNTSRSIGYTSGRVQSKSMFDYVFNTPFIERDAEHLQLMPTGDFYFREGGIAGWWYSYINVARPSWNLFEQVA